MNRFESRQAAARPARATAGVQRGSALIISLLILLLMTIIGVTALQTGALQERMAGNARDRQIAFEAAEAALRDAEELLTGNPGITFSNSNGMWQPNGIGQNARWNTVNWGQGSGDIREYAVTGDGFDTLSRNPAYIVEQLPPAPGDSDSLASDEPLPDMLMFRITARGWGGSTTTSVMLQSVFRMQ